MAAVLPQKTSPLLLALCLLLLTPTTVAHAQGCILARSPEQSGLPTGQGGVLQPGHFQVSVGERHQFSYQHYVGDVYQEYRTQQQTEVQNRINLVTLALTYQVTPRISVELDAPWLFASRKKQGTNIKYEASGLGDTILGVSSWLWDPQHAAKGNVSIGLGLYIPTGNDDVKNTVNTGTGSTVVETTTPVDYSIQPGTGGWGGMLEWMGFYRLPHDLTVYTDGDYIAMNGGTNGVQRGATLSTTTPLENYDAIADQYLVEAGLEFPIHQVRGLAATVGPRWEGVPAYNLFPVSNDGFRRPGYAVSVGPGLEYVRKGNILDVNIYKAVRRDRTVSYPDSVYNAHGDAAFAQYVWLASVTHRF
jgi:hypothetical protein